MVHHACCMIGRNHLSPNSTYLYATSLIILVLYSTKGLKKHKCAYNKIHAIQSIEDLFYV